MKLYYSKGACSLAVRIVINEIGANCDYESVNLKTKQTESGSDFNVINPKGSVPVLETDEKVILTEGPAIMQYLADKFNANQLLSPVGKMSRYHAIEWLNYITSELHKTIGALFNPVLTDEMREQFYVPMIRSKLTFVDKRLIHTYLLGDQFTLPDAYLFVILTWAQHFKFDLQDWPRLKNYFANLQKRTAIVKSLQEEKITATA